MASPLLEFANSKVLIVASDAVERNADGRFYVNDNAYHLLICYMKRVQYTGVTSGSRKIPLSSELNGEMLPGASGDEFYYRGYALEKATILSDDPWIQDDDITDYAFMPVTGEESFLRPQAETVFTFGTQAPMRAVIQRCNGKFGGSGIDQIIYPAIGIEFQLTGAEILS